MRSFVASSGSILVLCVAMVSALAPLASAQSPVDAIERTYESGRFRDAITAVQRTLATEQLDEPSLARILELEALSSHALGDREGLARSLAWLAAMGSAPELSRAAPPPVVAAYAQARERAMQVDLELVERAGRRRIELSLGDPPEGFVRETRMRVRIDGGSWIEASGVIDVPAEATTVEAHAWVVGPAHVVVHRIGSAHEPLLLLDAPASALSLAVAAPPPAQDDTVLWAVITTVIVVAVIGGAIAIGVALTPADDTILVPRGP